MRAALRLAGFVALSISGIAHGQTLVVDRGLPTANLNNAAGANRSNVAWTDNSPYFIGDNFTLGGAAGTTYKITTLQTWAVAQSGAPVSATLYTGFGANANLTATSATPTFDLVTYANGATYQADNGAAQFLYQVTFSGLDIDATAGSTISFGVDGVNQGNLAFFNHASNAALSGSPQDGADNLMSYYYHDGAGATYYGPFDSNGHGFNKSSDINVRVYASASPTGAVPEPATWGMMLVGMGLVGATLRRRERGVAHGRYAA